MQLSQTYCLEAKDRGKVVHELGHVIGFYHEHQRPDRDEYIEILWDNLINSDAIRSQYEIEPHTDNLGTDYDYNSVMHYGPTDNSANGNATMVIFDERFADKVGQRTRPSSTDYRQVNLFYNCIHDEGKIIGEKERGEGIVEGGGREGEERENGKRGTGEDGGERYF